MTDLVVTSIDRGVGVISLNRPEKHNAFNDEMWEQFNRAIAWAEDEPAVRATLIRGEGPSFSSGLDTGQLAREKTESQYRHIRHQQEGRIRQRGSVKPSIVAIHGYALGGAFEVALAGDIRICADDARMGLPEINYGIMTDTGGIPLAAIVAGPARAKWLLMTGEIIDADRALRWGLVDEVVPAAQVDQVARELAVRIGAGPPLAMAMIKQVVDGIWDSAFHTALRAELLAQTTLMASADHAEAVRARAQKRPPTYTGN